MMLPLSLSPFYNPLLSRPGKKSINGRFYIATGSRQLFNIGLSIVKTHHLQLLQLRGESRRRIWRRRHIGTSTNTAARADLIFPSVAMFRIKIQAWIVVCASFRINNVKVTSLWVFQPFPRLPNLLVFPKKRCLLSKSKKNKECQYSIIRKQFQSGTFLHIV